MDCVEVRRWTREEYDRMVAAGIFGPEERVELLEGEVVKIVTQGPRHARAICAAADALGAVFGSGHHVRVQLPVAPARDPCSEPEPDLSVVPGSWRDYEYHPTAAVLVVEVSDSMLVHDRERKGSLYARAGIPDYWIVNLPDRRLEVYRDPAPSESARYGWAYRSVTHFLPEERVSPLALPDAAVAVDALLE